MNRKIVNICMDKAVTAEENHDKAISALWLKRAEEAEAKLPEVCQLCEEECPGYSCQKNIQDAVS